MGLSEKLTAKASEQLGEPVEFATMVVPPGATLYKSYAASKVGSAAGPIAEAIASKSSARAEGRAGTVPRQMGVLGVTTDRLVYFKKKTLGSGCGELIQSWPRSVIASADFAQDGKWSYPGVLIGFDDGTEVAVFGEQRWDLEALAAALDPR